MTPGPGVEENGNHTGYYLLAAGGSDVLSTIREQKHLLHHRSHCRYHHRPQSARPVLAQGWIYFTTRKRALRVTLIPSTSRCGCKAVTFFCLDRYGIRRHFLALDELGCGARATCRAFARNRTVDDR